MSGLTLYFEYMSQPSRAVYIFLKMNRIPFKAQSLKLHKGEHQTPEYTKINPFQKVPAIDDNGFKLTESVAILKYLCAKYPNAITPNWYPADIQSKAKVDEYMSWQHLNTRMAGGMYFTLKVREPLLMNKSVNKSQLQEVEAQLTQALDNLEGVFLRNNTYIAGPDLTIADLLCVCELMQPLAGGLDVTIGRPRLAEWMTTVKGRLQPHFDDAHQYVRRVAEAMAQKSKI